MLIRIPPGFHVFSKGSKNYVQKINNAASWKWKWKMSSSHFEKKNFRFSSTARQEINTVTCENRGFLKFEFSLFIHYIVCRGPDFEEFVMCHRATWEIPNWYIDQANRNFLPLGMEYQCGAMRLTQIKEENWGIVSLLLPFAQKAIKKVTANQHQLKPTSIDSCLNYVSQNDASYF